jgi:hypothetical protein
MRQLIQNSYEKISSQDLNNLQLALQQGLYDDALYAFLGKQNGVMGVSFLASYVSALAASLAVGVGFYYDSSQTEYNPKYRMIRATSAIPITLAAASVSDRIDLICLAPNFVVAGTASRYVKSGGTGTIALETVDKDKAASYTLQVVTGTPGVSPAVPSTPSGYIAIAKCYVHATTGMASGADITDLRNQLVVAGTNVTQTQASGFTAASPTTHYLCDPAGGAFNATLPAAASSANVVFRMKNIAMLTGNNVTVLPTGADTIEAGASAVLTPGDSGVFVSDGVSKWWLFS